MADGDMDSTRDIKMDVGKLFFCSGMIRSGSTWAFNVMRLLLEHSDVSQTEFSSAFLEEDQLDSAIRSPLSTVCLIKFHHPTELAASAVRDGSAINVFTFRNPTDVIASCVDAFGFEFEEALDIAYTGLLARDYWRPVPGTLEVPYKDVLSSSSEMVSKIADHLDLTLSEQLIGDVARVCHWSSVKPHTEGADMSAASPLERRAMYDQKSYLHPGHIRNPDKRDGNGELTALQLQRVEEVIGHWVD